VALSDPGGILSSPLTIIDRTDERQDITAIIDIASQHQVGRIVVGLPRSLSGNEGKQAEKVRTFVQKLHGSTDVPLEFRDERLTTVSAKRLMRVATGKKAGRRDRADAVAAALILQGYLDEAHGLHKADDTQRHS